MPFEARVKLHMDIGQQLKFFYSDSSSANLNLPLAANRLREKLEIHATMLQCIDSLERPAKLEVNTSGM